MKSSAASKIKMTSLNSLLGGTDVSSNGVHRTLNISNIEENPKNREVFSMDDIDILSESIEKFDFTTPIEVYEMPDGVTYQVISGHRRLEAMKALGRETISAIVFPYTDEINAIERMIAGNVYNRQLSPLEWSRAIHLYISDVIEAKKKKTGVTVGNVDNECMKALGLKRGQYRRYKCLCNLVPELQKLLEVKDFPYTFFEAYGVSAMNEEQQRELAEFLEDNLENEESGLHLRISLKEINEKIKQIKGKEDFDDDSKLEKNESTDEPNESFPPIEEFNISDENMEVNESIKVPDFSMKKDREESIVSISDNAVPKVQEEINTSDKKVFLDEVAMHVYIKLKTTINSGYAIHDKMEMRKILDNTKLLISQIEKML